MSSRMKLKGKRFNKLVVLSFYKIINKNSYWNCLCDCGKKVIIAGRSLKDGNTKSCGCLRKKHRFYGTRQYTIWAAMKTRCFNKNNPRYKDWGGRGIIVCKKWKTFLGFWEDMEEGYREDLQIDRIDNNGNYQLGNCKWSTPKEQASNKRKRTVI